jgi:hypothetical protein
MLRRLAAVAAALVVIALPSAASAGTAPDPMAGAPAVGDCFDITLEQGNGKSLPGEDPVGCAGDHTAVVAAVGKLPARLDWDSPDRQLGRATGKVCSDGFHDLIGNNPLKWYRSQYALWQFNPTKAQRNDGARWFDCMVSIQGTRGLNELPEKLPKLSNNLPDEVARCVTRSYGYTTCAENHRWRSTYSFYARGKATDRNVDAAANRVCPSHVKGTGWLRSSWDVTGKRFIVGCYSKTRS